MDELYVWMDVCTSGFGCVKVKWMSTVQGRIDGPYAQPASQPHTHRKSERETHHAHPPPTGNVQQACAGPVVARVVDETQDFPLSLGQEHLHHLHTPARRGNRRHVVALCIARHDAAILLVVGPEEEADQAGQAHAAGPHQRRPAPVVPHVRLQASR